MHALTIIKEVRREGRALVQENLYEARRTRGMEQKKQRVEGLSGKERKKLKNQFNQPKYTHQRPFTRRDRQLQSFHRETPSIISWFARPGGTSGHT